MKHKKRLTVIIPFLNEKNEVANTLRSIRETSADVDIIIINDASTDGFDYETVAGSFDAVCITHEERKGVAASRDEGVAVCNTDYFLLLDAHMRFYQHDWADMLVNQLEKDDRVLLCCQTKALTIDEDNGIVCKTDRKTSYGAQVNLYDGLYLFEPGWIAKKPAAYRSEWLEIPCVLGAGYAASKRYWTYLGGLKGLEQYGNDEPYISMKVWSEGGRCLLATRLLIGHIYRDAPPYPMDFTCRVYNRLLLSRLLLPRVMAKMANSALKHAYKQECYLAVCRMLCDKEAEIRELKAYYQRILLNDTFFSINDHGALVRKIKNAKGLLKSLAYRVIMESRQVTNLGLLKGKMGQVIFLYQYARFSANKTIADLSTYLLDDLCEKIDGNTPANFCSGLWGIGWGLEYLSQKGFLNEDLDEMLQDVDQKVQEFNVRDMQDLDMDFGFGGMVLYIFSRLKGKNACASDLFRYDFMQAVKNKVEYCIFHADSDCLDVYIDFYHYLNGTTDAGDLSVFDIAFVSFPYEKYEHSCLQAMELDLKDGISGAGLNLIYELSNRKFEI